MKTYVITGATGHIGQRIAEALLEHKERVRCIGRSRERLAPLAAKGADTFVGTLADTEFLARVFQGADAVFGMIPPDLQATSVRVAQTFIGTSIATAIRTAGVKHVVNLSSQGAHLLTGTGPIVGLHEQEERLNRLPHVNVVHLRPGFFMENLVPNMPLMRTQGMNCTPLRGDLKIPVIATRDIARVAVECLLDLGFTGTSVRDLLGQRDLSMIEMTSMLGRAIDKPDLRYVQVSYEAARQAMLTSGISMDVARAFVEMYQGLNEGRIMRETARTIENSTETSFENFAVDFARLYAAQGAEVVPEPDGKESARKEKGRTHGFMWRVLHWHRAAA